MERTLNTALSWPVPSHVDALLGARLFMDGPRAPRPEVAISRAILRTNTRITAVGSLALATQTVLAAHRAGLAPEFLAATLLQESAYDPHALSAAGAVGIAQFTLDTARDVGVNPYDPLDAIDAAAELLGSYVAKYRGRYDDPYVDALAAYNAGPEAVAHFHGVPPYAETKDYVAIIYDRWARIGSYELRGSGIAPKPLKVAR